MSAVGVEIASGYLTIQTRMPGIQKTLDNALSRTNVGKAGENIGRRLSDSMGKSIKSTVATKFADITAGALNKQTAATKALSTAEFEHRKSRAGLAAANASVLVAEEKLTKLKTSGKASTGQLAAAEAALAKERTGLEAANRSVAQALVSVDAAKRNSTKTSEAYQEALSREQSKSARAAAYFPELASRMEQVGSKWQAAGQQMTAVGDRLYSNITKPAVVATSVVGGLVGALGFRRLVGIDRAKAQFEGLGYQVDAVMAQVDKGVTNTALSMADGAQLAVSSLAATVPLQELEKHIKRISNTSAAYGVEATHAGTLINQAYIDGRASYGLLSQMQQNSIPILSALADTYGKTGEEIKKMAQGGEISIEMLNNALDNKAGAAAESYARSWEGIYKNVLSNLGRFGESVLSGAFPQAKAALEGFLEMLRSDEAKAFGAELGVVLGEAFTRVLDRIQGLIQGWQNLDTWQQNTIRNMALLAIAAGPVLKVLGILAGGAGRVWTTASLASRAAGGWAQAMRGTKINALDLTGATVAQARAAKVGAAAHVVLTGAVRGAGGAFTTLAIAAKGNPLVFIASAVAAVVAGLVLFIRNTEAGRALWEKFTQAMQPVTAVLGEIGAKVADVFGSVVATVAPILATVIGTLADVFARIGPVIGQTLGTVGGVLANVFAAIGPVLGQIAGHIGSVFAAIGPAIGGVFSALAPLIGGVLTALAPVVTGLLEAIAPSLESLGTTGGQIGEAFAPLAPMFADTGARIVEAFGPVADTFRNELMPAFAELGAAFAGIIPQFVELISGVLATLVPLIVNLASALLPLFAQMLTNLIPLVVGLVQAFAPLITALASQILPIVMQVAQMALPILMQMFTALVPIIAQVVGAIAPLIADLVSKLVPVIMNIVTTVLPILMQVFMAVIPVILQVVAALAPLITTLLEVLIPIIGALLDVVATVFEALAPIIQGALQIVTGIITTITGIITGNWSMVWDGIKQIFVGIWNTIKAVVVGAINIVRSVIVNAITIIRTIWTTIWNGIKAILSGVWSFITSMVQTRIDQLKLGIQVGILYIRAVWENVWNTIRNVVSNVWTGIKSTVTTMMNWIKTKPKAAFESARDAIGDAWNGIKELAKKPVRFVIDTVINGMIRTINGFLPKKWKLSEVALPKGFRTGGWTGNAGVNEIAGVVHGREHVTRAESTAKLNRNHPGLLDHMNRYGSLPGYRKGGWVTPLPAGSYSVSQPFHSGHNGIDLAAATGTKVMAPAAGKVVQAGWEPGGSFGGGNQVNIMHPGGILTWFAHLSSIAARVGQQVAKGRTLGGVGSTGNSTGPHLHYMIETGSSGALGSGTWINPAPYMTGHTTPKGGTGAVDAADGLMGWVEKKLKDAGTGMWGDLGAGLAMSVAENVVEFIKSKIPVDIGQATLYDDGGWLQPGRHLTENRTGKPEPVFTSRQWDLLSDVRGGGGDSRPVYVQNPFTGEYLLAKVDERAEDAIDRAEDNAERNRRLVVGG